MKPDLPKIPQELKALPNWVVWRIENREGKPTKVPYNAAHPKQNAKANVPTTWGTYDEAVKAYEAGSFTGVGYEFSGADPFCGIDLDHCRNPETGEIKESARKIIKKLNSYTEVSPSGTGLHVWVKGLLPPGRRKQGGFEIYSDGRYFTLTGHHLKGTPPTIEDRQAEIEVLHLEIFGAPQARQAPPNPAILLALTDQELIILARQAANGNKFEALWRGDWSRYPSQSEATAALLNMLVFYRGQDPAGVDRLFRQSGLMRDKWDRPQAGGTWGALEVDKAISRATEFYSPRQRSSSPPPTRQAPEGGKDQAKTKQDGVIAELNSKHAVVMLGGKCVILNEVIDPTFNRPDITFSSVNDFRNYYSNRKVKITKEDNKLNIPLSTVWLESPMRRQYQGLVFCPGNDVPGYYNLYRGFPITPKKGDWSIFRNHIKEVIANNNDDIFNYLMGWKAQIVQDPGGERPGTSIALRGKMGTGKGCYVTQFGGILGLHFLHISNPNQLVGRFNNHLKDCLCCFVDEAIWAGDKTSEGILKGMITERLIMVEPKGKDAFAVQNHIRLIVASNSDWIIPCGFEERRFLVLDVADIHMQDHEYFSALFKQMDNGGREAFLYDLLELDLSGINLRKIPRTEALLDQVVHTMPTAAKFWFERLRASTLLKEHREWELFVISDKLYSEYVNFAADVGDRYRLINRQFGKEIRRLCPDVRRGRREIEGRDRYVLYVPELDTCREAFEARVGVNINWESKSPPEGDSPF